MFPPPAHQFHTPPDHISQTNAGTDFVDELGRKRHLQPETPSGSVRADLL